jgi:hypothetical protein
MESKTLSTVLIVILCIIFFPLIIGVVGGAFGIVIGVFGAVFGVIFGVLGGILGAIFSIFGWLFESIFGWGDWDWHFGFFNWNFCTIALIVLIVALAARSKKR